MVSDAFRYARILNGFSFLISSRSAISEKMRAMARFSMTRGLRSRSGSRESGRLPDCSACLTAGASPGSATQKRHPPPPAPQTFAARAPAAKALEIRDSINGVVTPGASFLRASHSRLICVLRPFQSPAANASRTPPAASAMRSKQSKTCRSPSIWRLVISQLLVPEKCGAPV